MKCRNRSIHAEVEECLSSMRGDEFKKLTKDETNNLVIKFQKGDRESGDKLVNSNVLLFKGYVIKKKIVNTEIKVDDLFQLVRYGIYEAAKKFDVNHESKAIFKTYCHWYVNKNFREYERESRVVWIPKHNEYKPNKKDLNNIAMFKSRVEFEHVDIISLDHNKERESFENNEEINYLIGNLNKKHKELISGLFGLNGSNILNNIEVRIKSRMTHGESIPKEKEIALQVMRGLVQW